MSDSLAALASQGVSIWLDDLSRDRIATGNLAGLVADRHVVGVTTNPTIFEKAIAGSDRYAGQLADLAARGVDVGEALRAITTYDVRDACDLLAAAYRDSDHQDGRVSIEVDPRLAHRAAPTAAEARALWWLVDRPNLFIKIPATLDGLPAITEVLAGGISVNVTLIFSVDRYRAVMDAWMAGLERAREAGHDLAGIAGVASFFVSRVDSEVDRRLDAIGTPEAAALRGQAAVANARLAYEAYQHVVASARWQALAAAGARPQRPLWASTSTKDPALPDTVYVTELVAPGTVNTMPEGTILAVADHGEITGDTVSGRAEQARVLFDRLAGLGIAYGDVVDTLEREGVAKFQASWVSLLDSVAAKLREGRRRVTGRAPGRAARPASGLRPAGRWRRGGAG